MRLIRTCDACPEQYDVFQGKRNIGYLRLRWGHFVAEYLPAGRLDHTAVVVYEHQFPDGLRGEFRDESERERYLKRAVKAIRQKDQEGRS